jgi:HAD superfamily hydrolase (TIGR01549 family)
MAPYNIIVFDLGDVLFTWSQQTDTKVSPKTMRKIISMPAWYEYEKGLLARDACYEQIGDELGLPAVEIANAFEQARDSLREDRRMTAFIHQIKARKPNLSVYAMSNISREDYDFLRTTVEADWSLFDRVFPSGHAGMRKPDVQFFKHVLREISGKPEEVIMVDDKLENIESARSLGIHGVQFTDPAKAREQIQQLLGVVGDGSTSLRVNER